MRWRWPKLGFDGKKQLEKTRHVPAAPGSQPVGRDCATVPVCWTKERSRNSTLQLERLCMWDKTDQRRRQVSCLDRHALPDARSNDGASTTVRYLWTFPLRSMPTKVRAITDANWAGELEALRSSSSGWMYFGGHLLETYSSTQQIVALSTAESEYMSFTNVAAHALEVRSAMAEWSLSLKVCGTDANWTGNGHKAWRRPGASLGSAVAVAATVVRRRRGRNANQSWRAQ